MRIHYIYHQTRLEYITFLSSVCLCSIHLQQFIIFPTFKTFRLHLPSLSQIRALEKKKKSGKFAQKVKAKTRRRMHEMSNPLEQDEFADMWKE